MKTLEELGVSEAPWRVTAISINEGDIRGSAVTVLDAGGKVLAKDSLFRHPDANLTAAAPDLYNALKAAIPILEWVTGYDNEEIAGKAKQKLDDARKALSEAGGRRN